jgi:hypothetical protein
VDFADYDGGARLRGPEFHGRYDEQGRHFLQFLYLMHFFPSLVSRFQYQQIRAFTLKAVFRIRDILVRIRILGSLPLTDGSGSGFGSVPKFLVTFTMQIISVSGAILGTSLPPTPNWSRFDLFIDGYSILFYYIFSYTLYFIYCIVTYCKVIHAVLLLLLWVFVCKSIIYIF